MDRRILLIGPDHARNEAHRASLTRGGYDVRCVAPDLEALGELEEFRPEVLVVDLAAEAEPARAMLELGKARFPECAVVGLTASAEVAEVVGAVTIGADSALPAEARTPELEPLIERALEKADASHDAARFRRRAESVLSAAHFDSVLGTHPTTQALLKKVAQVASTRATVLLYGETGTGKELIAAAIHQNSKRHQGPLVRLNCAALADSVLESELFGHERGAFTGATSRREGRFKQADGGTLFLDEISELPLSVQVKLLRFLQEREFERVGGNETLRVDVRVVAATNKNLKAMIEDGGFREDLYYRLNVVRLDVPPLRARPSDILLLAEHFLRQAAADNEVDCEGFTEEAQQALLAYPWPGNIRELQNVVEQAVVLSESAHIGTDDLAIAIEPDPAAALRLMIPGATLEEIERYAVVETLKAVGGSTAKAAEILGISRRTVQYRVKEWGLGEAGAPSRDDAAEEAPNS